MKKFLDKMFGKLVKDDSEKKSSLKKELTTEEALRRVGGSFSKK